MTEQDCRDIITAGRDDALGMAFPLCEWIAAYQLALDGGFAFNVSSCFCCGIQTGSPAAQKVGNLWFPSFRRAKTADVSNRRFETSAPRGNHNDQINNLKVTHDLTSFAFVEHQR